MQYNTLVFLITVVLKILNTIVKAIANYSYIYSIIPRYINI